MSDGVCELSRIKGAGWLCTKPINGWIKCGQNTFKGQKISKAIYGVLNEQKNKSKFEIDLFFHSFELS